MTGDLGWIDNRATPAIAAPLRRSSRFNVSAATCGNPIVREHSGVYGMGVDYAYTMVHKTPQRTSKLHEMLAPVPA